MSILSVCLYVYHARLVSMVESELQFNALELELRTVVNCYVVLETQPRSPVTALKYWATSLGLHLLSQCSAEAGETRRDKATLLTKLTTGYTVTWGLTLPFLQKLSFPIWKKKKRDTIFKTTHESHTLKHCLGRGSSGYKSAHPKCFLCSHCKGMHACVRAP